MSNQNRYFHKKDIFRDESPRKKIKTEQNFSYIFKIDGAKKKANDSSQNSVTSAHKDKTDIENLISYYKNVLNSLNDFTEDDMVLNALNECSGSEVELSCNPASAHCLELLLMQCKDSQTYVRFMKAFSTSKEKVSTTSCATHITELLLYVALQNIQHWSSTLEDNVTLENTAFFTDWIGEFGCFLEENIKCFLDTQEACHVACSILRALGGDMGKDTTHRSKRSEEYKKNLRQQFLNEDDDSMKNFQEEITLNEIPLTFKNFLKKIVKAVLQIINLSDYITYSPSAAVIEALLIVTHKRLPKYCNKLISGLMKNIFADKDRNGVPIAFTHKNSSFVVEKLFKCSGDEVQQRVWEEHLQFSVECLLVHPVGNHVIQRFIDAIETKALFESFYNKISCTFNNILNSRHYGVFVALAKACCKLKTKQTSFWQNMLQCLGCEDEKYLAQIVPSLLRFEFHDQNNKTLIVCLQGSLLVQTLLKFEKPIKLVQSLLAMPATDIAYLICHPQGCHVITTFFGSPTIGKKKKDDLLLNITTVLGLIACKSSGSLTFSRIWVQLQIAQKAMLAEALLKESSTLRSNTTARALLNKCGVYHFNKNRKQWEQMEESLEKRFKKKYCI